MQSLLKYLFVPVLLLTLASAQQAPAASHAKTTANLPSEETVNAFLHQWFGYDTSLTWKIVSIKPSEIEGLSEINAVLSGAQGQQRQGAQAMGALTAQEQQGSKMIYQQFQQIMQRSAAEHQAFMQQQESQFESAMNNAYASMDAQSTAASDWVDYSLNQETVMNPDGSTTKVSDAYSQTWTDGTHWYQSNETGLNPNGVLQGTWTQSTQVHGNGTPE